MLSLVFLIALSCVCCTSWEACFILIYCIKIREYYLGLSPELKEQLLARTSHMEEMEYLKKDFQLKWDKKKSEHENELEQLRLYFEQKLKSVEENYREELTMLHQRLREMKDYSLLEVENSQDLHAEFG